MEIKKSAAPGKDAVRHFKVLEALKEPIGPGGVVCLAEQRVPLSSTVQTIPVGLL